MSSAAFDTYLILVWPDGRPVKEDDDSGGERNSFISLDALPSSGTYTVQATAESAGGRGEYSLLVTAGCYTVKSISAGQTAGSLASVDCETPYRANSKAELYLLNGRAGQQVTITMSALSESPNLDPFLILIGPDGRKLTEDDDGGGGLSARIGNYRLPSSGMYLIVATSADAYNPKENKGTGKYNLSLSVN